MIYTSHLIACYIQSPYIGTDKVLAIRQRKLEAATNEFAAMYALAIQDHEAEQMRQKESAEMAAVAATAASEAAAVVVADNAAAAAVTMQGISSDRYVRLLVYSLGV